MLYQIYDQKLILWLENECIFIYLILVGKLCVPNYEYIKLGRNKTGGISCCAGHKTAIISGIIKKLNPLRIRREDDLDLLG